jgi:EthD domain
MIRPVRTTSMLSPLMLRSDMARDAVTTYWANDHAAKVKKLPNVLEYNQRLFSTTDHGYWPATPSVGTTIPETWRVDGCAELRFHSIAAMLMTAPHAREVYLDEQNIFARVLGQPNSAICWVAPSATACWSPWESARSPNT